MTVGDGVGVARCLGVMALGVMGGGVSGVGFGVSEPLGEHATIAAATATVAAIMRNFTPRPPVVRERHCP